MKLITLLEKINDNSRVEVYDNLNNLLSVYDGKNSIDEIYNNCKVKELNHDKETIKDSRLFIIII